VGGNIYNKHITDLHLSDQLSNRQAKN